MTFKAVQAMLLGAAVAVAGCDSSGGITGGGIPDGFSFLGTWQLHVDAATNCWPAFDVRIGITQASLTAGANGAAQVMNPAGWWYIEAPGPDTPFTLSGTLNQNTGTFSFLLWKNNNSSTQGHFDGTATGVTNISGTFTDPDGAFRTSAGTHPCSSTAHATKD